MSGLVLPGITGGSAKIFPCMYPMTRTTAFDTKIVQFMDSSEQRWKNRGALEAWTLEYSQLSITDRANFDTFFDTTQGKSGAFSFVRGGTDGVVVVSCQFIDESFSWTQNGSYPGQWDGSIRFRQRASSGAAPPNNSPGPFPVLSRDPVTQRGSVTGYPFVRSQNFKTNAVEMDTGSIITQPLYGAGLAGYPTRALYQWTLTHTTLTDANLALLFNHFFAAGGMYSTFQFTDPEVGRVFNRVGYASDSFSIQYRMPGISAVTMKLREVFGPGWTA